MLSKITNKTTDNKTETSNNITYEENIDEISKSGVKSKEELQVNEEKVEKIIGPVKKDKLRFISEKMKDRLRVFFGNAKKLEKIQNVLRCFYGTLEKIMKIIRTSQKRMFSEM